MACCGRSDAKANIAYKVTYPDKTSAYAETVGEARVMRASVENSYAVVIRQVPITEYQAWKQAQAMANEPVVE